jgi:hypothetical protein
MKQPQAMYFSDPTEPESGLSFALVNLLPLTELGLTSHTPLLAHVPFDFFVGEIKLDAGTYEVDPSDQSDMLALRRSDGDSPCILVQAIRSPGDHATMANKLLFYWRCDRYFLAQAFAPAN